MEYKFRAEIEIIGINPYVAVPQDILGHIFRQAGKTKGFIPIRGTINGEPYTQTLVKYSGLWRLYVNTRMLKNSPDRIGETVEITVAFDPVERKIAPHPKLSEALERSAEARAAFESLPPSRRHEIIRYIASLKTDAGIERNVEQTVAFLSGSGRFVGREKP